MFKNQYLSLFFVGMILSACSGAEENLSDDLSGNEPQVEEAIDHHSYSNVRDVRTSHLHLNLNVDFDSKTISGSALHSIENITKSKTMVFDVYDLKIDKVILDGQFETTYSIGEKDELHGAPLTVDINENTKNVEIFYSTDPSAQGLQWLNPQQTSGKEYPYLYSQGQAILTRSWIPCQDTPGIRITYSADVKVPVDLMAVMSADNPTEKSEDGRYSFKMDIPIPSYLIALAVGDLEFEPLGERTGVYTEPSMMDKCEYEFVDVEKMVNTAEKLYGEYKWGRYDLIVLPPSFPFGGMENPKLTFATPTIISGDRSLVSLVAHELAHSWSGNLVTNATWDDFWLNEGFTVYFENRIMEEIYGVEYAEMLMQIEFEGLEFENEMILKGDHPEDTKLKLDLEGRNPDDGMTAIAYVKGALFLKTLENTVGRVKFDEFLNKYFDDHKFQTITTEIFLAYLDKNLLKPNKVEFNTNEWVYEEGIPNNCIHIHSDNFDKVDEKCQKITSIYSALELDVKREDWSTHEWIHFIRHIPAEADADDLAMLDKEFHFSNWGNSEIMAEWYLVAIEKNYDKIEPYMEDFLIHVGRRKFLEPIYGELAKTKQGMELAKEIYAKARPNYHSISYMTIDEILEWDSI
ncbi:MAG: M1 family metallopeptidase [Crocinitomicaceae bacterium]|nr:M1 family metallopeptidase [Crocinitomicaceae bacterium]